MTPHLRKGNDERNERYRDEEVEVDHGMEEEDTRDHEDEDF
jgi:hypothetical protein